MRTLGDPSMKSDIASLAQLFRTSERTIRRDILELKRQGIEVQESIGPKNHKTYALDRGSLPPIRLTFDEALAIFFGKSQLSSFKGSGIEEAAESAYAKLRIWLGESEAKYVEKISERVHFARQFGVRLDQSEIVDDMMVALEDCRAIFIEYRSANSTEPLTYDIYPYGLMDHRGSLYVVGHSCHHDEIRTWKMDRIQSTELTPFPFKRPVDFVISRYFEGAFGVITGDVTRLVRIRITGNAVPYALERTFHSSQQTHVQPDGSVIIELQLRSLLEIKSWVLSFGSKAYVLEPQELRTEIMRELRQLSERYDSDMNTFDPLPNQAQ